MPTRYSNHHYGYHLYYLNDVCTKVESGHCKAGWGLLGCHIQLTVSASPVSCNPLNTNLLSSVLTFIWLVVPTTSSSLYPKFIHTLFSQVLRVKMSLKSFLTSLLLNL